MSAPDNSRTRLLAAAKTLFARSGYEHTPTSAIAREAGTSESQLVRYFGSKGGLLEALFEESWVPLNARVKDLLADARDARAAVMGVLGAMLAALNRDEELATIFLFEGRRIRAESHEIRLSSGFIDFSDVVQRLIRRGQKDGSFAPAFDAGAMAAALIGAVEGMLRERAVARRGGTPRPFNDRQVIKIMEAVLDALKNGKT